MADKNNMIYECCVVGAGMVGSAAAKWLAMQEGSNVCLVGPQEPTQHEWESRTIFSAHYDEGRITRELAQDPIWGRLAQRSIQRYRQIEQETGIKFYNEAGCIFIDKKGSEGQERYLECAKELDIQHEVIGPEEFHRRFPYLQLREEVCERIWTLSNAGHISPRKLLKAQLGIAKRHGCDVINDVAVKVAEDEEDAEIMTVLTENGVVIRARRVLLCAGAFTNFYELLPDGDQLDLNLSKVLVVKAELTEEDANKLRGCPSISLENERCYALPPILYPDGKWYMKIGLWCSFENDFGTLREAADWFRSQGQGADATDTIDSMTGLFPGLKPVSLTTDCCIVSSTPTKRLYCGMATQRVGVLAGMCGVGAKSSDEIGRMGATMISSDSWSYDLPAEYFKLRFKKK